MPLFDIIGMEHPTPEAVLGMPRSYYGPMLHALPPTPALFQSQSAVVSVAQPGRVEYMQAFQRLGQVWQGKADPAVAFHDFKVAADLGSVPAMKCLQEGCSARDAKTVEFQGPEAWYQKTFTSEGLSGLETVWTKGGWHEAGKNVIEVIDGQRVTSKGRIVIVAQADKAATLHLLGGVAAGTVGGGPSAKVLDLAEPLRILSQPPLPSLPPAAKEAGIQGPVVVEVLVGPDGRVSSAKAVEGAKELKHAAEIYTFGWRFEPAVENCEARSARFRVVVAFASGPAAAKP